MPSKYPCGSCNIGVKFSGIKCTGLCKQWYHAGCQNILDKSLKKWATHEIEKWKCNNCKIDQQSCLQNQEIADPTALNISVSIQELENSLVENNYLENSDNQEEKLKMAAKIGSVLVEENESLNEKIMKLQTELTIMEGKIEEKETEEKKYIDKIETLLQLNSEVHAQLTKEKQLRLEAQSIFEEHDQKLEQLIDTYAEKIRDLEKNISKLQVKIKDQDMTNKTHTDSSTQTSPVKDNHINKSNPTSLLLEISEIKTKLDRIELSVNALTPGASQTCSSKLRNALTITTTDLTSLTPTSGSSQTSNQKLKNTMHMHALTTHMTDLSKTSTSGASQTCNSKLNQSVSTSMTNTCQYSTTADRHSSVKKPRNTWTKPLKENLVENTDKEMKKNLQPNSNKITSNKKINIFSVSLQAAKYKESEKLSQTALSNKNVPNPSKTVHIPRIKSPPITAKKLRENETYEEFFEENIKYYEQYNKICKPIQPQGNKQPEENKLLQAEETPKPCFLGERKIQEERWKHATRLVINSGLQQRRN